MKCKKCGERMYVRSTLPTGPDSTVRTYFCKKCFSTADTHETRTHFQNGPEIINDKKTETDKSA